MIQIKKKGVFKEKCSRTQLSFRKKLIPLPAFSGCSQSAGAFVALHFGRLILNVKLKKGNKEMKKIFMTLAAAVVAVSASAQVWVGGELGFSSNHVNGNDDSDKTFTIAPEIGYDLDENLSVAIKLGYSYAGTRSIIGNDYNNVNAYTINPYARYTFVKVGNFSAFVDGGIHYTTLHVQGAENNFNQMGVAVNPGIAYAVSDKVTLVSHLGDGLYYNHTWLKDAYRSNNFGLDLFNGISFGAYYNF